MSEQPETKAVIQARNIHRYLGEGERRVHVLRGVSVELQPAKTYAIVGPSGSGKSTLLYLLGLLDRQDEGDIHIDGQRLSHATDRQRTDARNRFLGFVFQFHFLLPEFTALENVIMPMLKLGQLQRPEMEARGRELLACVGLEEKATRPATHLSGGEQQRVAVARSLANDPRLLLADEPTGNLDVKNSDRVFDLLQELAHERGQAILMVTHNDQLAQRTDHRLQMRDGLIVED